MSSPIQHFSFGEFMRHSITALFVIVLAAGCADQVTGPAASAGKPLLYEAPSGCVTDGVCILEPVVIGGQPGSGGGSSGGGGGGGGTNEPERGACPTSVDGYDVVQGCTAVGYVPLDDEGLPGDVDGDGDTWDDGPGAWLLCISAVLTLTASGAGTYYVMEDYHHKVDVLNAATLRLDHYVRNYGAGGAEYLALSNAYYDAKAEARIAAGVAASTAGVTVGALIGAGVVCAPLIAAPTP